MALPAAARTKFDEVYLAGSEYYTTMMRAATIVALALGAEAFLKPAAPKAATQLAAYVPSGMSKAEYEALKKKVRTRCEKIRTGLVKKSAPPARERRQSVPRLAPDSLSPIAGSRRQEEEELRRRRRARFRK